jgi:hypothetical protein
MLRHHRFKQTLEGDETYDIEAGGWDEFSGCQTLDMVRTGASKIQAKNRPP